MKLLPDKIFGRDIDDVFAYPTTKFVRIRDARLGLFKIALALSIVVYVGVYELWYEGLYLEESGVTGAVRFSLQQPTVNGCDPTDPQCANTFRSTSSLPYCNQSGVEQYYKGNKFPCEYYENIGAQVVTSGGLLVVTRQTTYEQTLVCTASLDDNNTFCPHVYDIDSSSTTYVADAERYTVLIDHSVIAASLNKRVARPSAHLRGRLYVKSSHSLCEEYQGYSDVFGSKRTRKAPCYVTPNETSRNLDFFSLDVLMRATGVTLDDENYDGQTYRETGTSLLLSIVYQNFRNWHGKGQVVYSYQPYVVQGTSYKVYDPIYDASSSSYRQSRTLLNKHGIFIEAAQGGVLHGFSFNNLLVQLTTSLTLFAVATLLTDFAALYLLPDAKVYSDYKFEETPDFSDIRQEQEQMRRRLLRGEEGEEQKDHQYLEVETNEQENPLVAALVTTTRENNDGSTSP